MGDGLYPSGMTTALITGATAGMGAAFARRLAAEHADLVLVARDGARLEQAAASLREAYGVDVAVLPADLATRDGCARVERRLLEAPVDLLVNNAGMGLGGRFEQRSIDDSERLTKLNVLAVMRLSHAALQGMLARGRGDIVNVSSVAGFVPGARDATYSASKAWVTMFSESLHEQVRGRGVRVLAVCPGFVHTEFHQRAGLDMSGLPDALWTDAEQVVAEALHALRRGRAVVVPGRQYKVVVQAVRHLPRSLVRTATSRAARRTR